MPFFLSKVYNLYRLLCNTYRRTSFFEHAIKNDENLERYLFFFKLFNRSTTRKCVHTVYKQQNNTSIICNHY